MNVLFLSLGKYNTIYKPGIYTDLLRKIKENGHNLYVLSPFEKRDNEQERVIDDNGCKIIKIYTGNIQKTNIIEKGINTVLIERRFIRAIKKYIQDIDFDLSEDDYPVSALAAEASLSPYAFTEAFKQVTGLTPHAYLIDRRVRCAAADLKSGRSTVAVVVDKWRFSSAQHMATAFRRILGVLPKQICKRPSINKGENEQ